MHPEEGPIALAVSRLTERFGPPPVLAVVLGSGLGDLVGRMTEVKRAPYADLGLPQGTVAGHASELVYGRLGDRPVAVLSGRVHLYEGRSPAEVVRYVRVLARWGVRGLLLTNSVGGITPGFDPGTLVIVTDHLNFQGTNPLCGPAFGTRFPDLSRTYDRELRKILARSAEARGARAVEGVLAAMLGPSYESPAEIRMLGRLGADVVGMSTVPEAIAAAEIGLRCAVLSLVSNRAAGLAGHPLTHEEVTAAAKAAGVALAEIVADTVAAYDGESTVSSEVPVSAPSIRKVSTASAPGAIGPYSQAIVANGFVFVSGQIAIDPATGQLVDGDVAAHTRRILTNVAAILGAAGSGLDRVLKTTVFLKSMNDFAAMNAAYAEMFGQTLPARSTVEVARLPRDVPIEIEVVALA